MGNILLTDMGCQYVADLRYPLVSDVGFGNVGYLLMEGQINGPFLPFSSVPIFFFFGSGCHCS